jgi:hypothetical protein
MEMNLKDIVATSRAAHAAALSAAPSETNSETDSSSKENFEIIKTAFGVIVDEDFEDFDPPPGYSEIGIITEFKDDGDIRDNIIDVAIGYGNSPKPVAVLFEVPLEAQYDATYLISTVEAVKASLTLLPPEEITDENFELYCQRLEEMTRLWTSPSKLNFATSIYPITSYFMHMIVEILNPELGNTFVPDDPYILERFHNHIPQDKADAMKARIRAEVLKSFTNLDGEVVFKETMIALCRKELNNVEVITKDLRDSYILNSQASETGAVADVQNTEAASD